MEKSRSQGAKPGIHFHKNAPTMHEVEAEWLALYREKWASVSQNEVKISNRRDQIFGQQVQKIMNGV